MSDRSKTNRREFLTGRSALKAVQERGADALAAPTTAGTDQRQVDYVEKYSKNAMGCNFEMLFNLQQYPNAAASALKVFRLIDLLEDQLSVFRDHSEVNKLNQDAFSAPIPVERHLFELLQLSLTIYNDTAGAFDITAAPLSKLWRLHRSVGNLPDENEVRSTLRRVGAASLKLLDKEMSVQFDKRDLAIDLGGIGKGYALDRARQLLTDRAISDYVLHGGQSSVIACGHSIVTNAEDKNGWSVGISHPLIAQTRLAEVTLRDRALGTSGSARQGFFHNGRRYGHVVDPRSGWPPDHCLSATVISDSAAICDALSTAFFVMSPENVESYCRRHPDIGAFLVLPGQSDGQIQIRSFNIDDADWTTADSFAAP